MCPGALKAIARLAPQPRNYSLMLRCWRRATRRRARYLLNTLDRALGQRQGLAERPRRRVGSSNSLRRGRVPTPGGCVLAINPFVVS